MKYFTPELYQQFNSLDEDEADKADEAWDQAEAAYKERLASIRPQMPQQVAKLSELNLHDAQVVSLEERAEPMGAWPSTEEPHHYRPFVSWANVALLSLAADDEVVTLIYFLSDHITKTDAPSDWRFSKLQEHWLYDEVDMTNGPTGSFIHRIMFSTGRTLEIPFFSVIIHQFKAPSVARVKRQSA